jgi:hypothetical protein
MEGVVRKLDLVGNGIQMIGTDLKEEGETVLAMQGELQEM